MSPLITRTGSIGHFEEAERAAGAERDVLIDVLDIDAEGLAVAEMLHDFFGLIVRADVDVLDADIAQLLDDELHDRGGRRRGASAWWRLSVERTEARAFSAGHDHGAEAVWRPRAWKSARIDDIDQTAPSGPRTATGGRSVRA